MDLIQATIDERWLLFSLFSDGRWWTVVVVVFCWRLKGLYTETKTWEEEEERKKWRERISSACNRLCAELGWNDADGGSSTIHEVETITTPTTSWSTAWNGRRSYSIWAEWNTENNVRETIIADETIQIGLHHHSIGTLCWRWAHDWVPSSSSIPCECTFSLFAIHAATQ